MQVNNIESNMTPFVVNHLTNLTVKNDEIMVHKEIIKVKIPWNAGDISKYWDIAGQDDAISESGRPNDINIR